MVTFFSVRSTLLVYGERVFLVVARKTVFLTNDSVQRGAGLVEVMVALVLSTAGILGFLTLQQRSLEAVHNVIWRHAAQRLSENVFAVLQLNTEAAAQYAALLNDQDLAPGAGACSSELPCATNEMARADVGYLRSQLSAWLPRARMALLPCGEGPSAYCVTIAWRGEAPEACAQDQTSAAHCFRSVPIMVLPSQGWRGLVDE